MVLVQAEIGFTWGEDGASDDVPDRDAAVIGTAQAGEDVVVGMESGVALGSAETTPRETPPIESPLRGLLPWTPPSIDDQDAVRSSWSA